MNEKTTGTSVMGIITGRINSRNINWGKVILNNGDEKAPTGVEAHTHQRHVADFYGLVHKEPAFL